MMINQSVKIKVAVIVFSIVALIRAVPWKVPAIKYFILQNGLKLMVIERHDQPAVLLSLMMRSGSLCDPLGKEGLVEMTGALLKQGTKQYTAEAIAQKIDYTGTRFNIWTGQDHSMIQMMTLKKDYESNLELFSDIVTSPIFPAEEIKRIKTEMVSNVKSVLDEPRAIADEHLRFLLYGHHPLGHTQSAKSIKSISRKDITDLFGKTFRPDNAVLLVIGDIDAADVKRDIEDVFGEWSPGVHRLDSLLSKPTQQLKGIKIRLIDKPNLTQSFIALGFQSIKRNSPDYFSYLIMNYILGGGGFSSRLPIVVRAQQGKTYGISSRFEAGVLAGPLIIRTFTNSAETYRTIELILQVIKGMKEKGIELEELRNAKDHEIGGFPLRFETPQDLANEILMTELYGLGPEYLESFNESVENLMIEDINQAANKYLLVDDFVLVVVGNSREVDALLTPLGTVEKLDFKKPVY